MPELNPSGAGDGRAQMWIKGSLFQEETTACSEVQRIDLACVFWASLALPVSSSHVRALLGGELTRELKGKK